MNVYRDSWHYRWIAQTWDERPNNLCWYFWKLVFTVIWWTGVLVFALFLAAGCFVLFVLPIFESASSVDAFIAVTGWTVFGVAVSYHYRQHLYRIGRLTRKPKEHKEPSLLSEYIHAKHRKICPLIDYK